MANDESEEKNLPASKKKLTDARRKGQVSNSKDLVSGFTMLAAVLYLMYQWPMMRDRLVELINVVSSSTERPFAEVWPRAVYGTIEVLVMTTVPLLALVFAVAVVMGMAATAGPVFSFETVKLQFDHISPMKGAKRIFSSRNVMEFVKSLAKVVVLTAAFWTVLRGFIPPLFQTPSCGEGCLGQMVISTLQPLAMTAAIAFVVIGVLDMPLQRHLFLREMRMSLTEKKKEMKELDGNPQIKAERRRLQFMFAAKKKVRKGVRHAVVVVAQEDRVVGLLYHREEEPVPLICSKARGQAGDEMVAEARRLGIPVVEDASLVDLLIPHAVGNRIPQDTFTDVARLLIRFEI
jgi:type III secretion protein U